jgi:hypothetical protein
MLRRAIARAARLVGRSRGDFPHSGHFFVPKYFLNNSGSGGGSSFWIGIR